MQRDESGELAHVFGTWLVSNVVVRLFFRPSWARWCCCLLTHGLRPFDFAQGRLWAAIYRRFAAEFQCVSLRLLLLPHLLFDHLKGAADFVSHVVKICGQQRILRIDDHIYTQSDGRVRKPDGLA